MTKSFVIRYVLAGTVALASYATLFAADSVQPEPITFNGQIASIMHENCTSCHREGQAAPFTLLTYEDAAKRAQLIRAVTQSRYMPPWHATPGYGSFKGERRLDDADVALIAKWVEAGAPKGGGTPPQPPEFPEGWRLGEPDLVVSMVEPYTVPADGPDIYRNFPAKVPTTEDKWVRAIEFRPEARTVVHHSLFKADPSGRSTLLDAKDAEPGYGGMGRNPIRGRVSLGGWAVGGNARIFPEDAPIRLPAGSDFVFESHFHPSGKQETERSTAALYFTDKAPTRSRVSFQLPPRYGLGSGINIDPGDSDFVIKESFTTPKPLEIYGVTPHAHYIGKEFKSWAVTLEGKEIPLIWIKDWDFSWQDMYTYAEPVVIPAGATIHARIRYDNSADNPRNPTSPPKRVVWGLGSEDEMGSVTFTALPVNESDVAEIKAALRVLSKKHEKLIREYRRTRPAEALSEVKRTAGTDD